MDEEDLKKLFLSVVEDQSQNTQAILQVFTVLIRSTLKYRDHMLVSKGIVITVEDVRIALRWLVPAFATGEMPETENKKSLGLLELWVHELGKKAR